MSVEVSSYPLPKSHWGQQVFTTAIDVQRRLGAHDPAVDSAVEARANSYLADALRTASAEDVGWRTRLHEWWSGSRVEMSWSYIRAAELELAGPDQKQQEKNFKASAEFHGAVRAFRNRLLVIKMVIVPVVIGIVVIQALVPAAQIVADPIDDPHPARWIVVALIMLFGVIGALLTSIPAMSKIPRVASPYNFPMQQGLVKVAVGSLAALIGVVAIDYGTSGFDSLQKMLAAAVVFGAGQQAVTSFLDTRARTIIDSNKKNDKTPPK